jgi:hypothetical protein
MQQAPTLGLADAWLQSQLKVADDLISNFASVRDFLLPYTKLNSNNELTLAFNQQKLNRILNIKVT